MAKKIFVDQLDGPLVIYVGRQRDGAVYELGTLSAVRLEEAFPQIRRIPGMLIDYENKDDFERLHRPHWEKVAIMLTELTPDQIGELGGLYLYEPETESKWDLVPAAKPSQTGIRSSKASRTLSKS